MSAEKSDIPFPPEQLSEKLLSWYGQHGRDLPWRHTRDPYCIWISEIMLQQTTVSAVIPYYQKFLAVFPDVEKLADAGLEAVLELWSGLGYYSRARNLHKAAIFIVEKYRGCFPDNVEELMQLPGVGRSTAGAIVSIAYDQPAPILDGNVRRVLVRLMAMQEPPRDRLSEKQLWAWAEEFTPVTRPHDYAQAIMDLGATICLPRKPQCSACPLQNICQAKLANLENVLPVKSRKSQVPIRRQVVLLIDNSGELLVKRRPAEGLLGGMWEFPNQSVTGKEGVEKVLQELLQEHLLSASADFVGTINHIYSHFRLEAEVYRVRSGGNSKIAENGPFWHDAGKLVQSPLHGAHQKVLKLLLKEENNDECSDTDD